ncbi:hypothetical protein V8C34DRAFT_304301 [Trichoderma compactum]
MSSPLNPQGADIQAQMVLNFLVALFDAFEQHRQEVRMYHVMQLQYCHELRQLAVEMIARAKNADRRKENRLVQSVFGTTRPLVPLVDVRTGQDIEPFPTTVEEICSLDGNQSRRILEALGVAIFAGQLGEPINPELEVRLLFSGQEISQPQDLMAVVHHRVQRDEKMLDEDIDGDVPWKDFGLCTVIRSILEDSGYFKTFLESPEFMSNLKLEHPRGADPLATDNQGKHALHQLLDAPSWPDHNGLTPIHSSIRRMWSYANYPYKWFCPLEDTVLDLINAGADIHARDAQGNAVIHYLADGFLDAPKGAESRKKLFYTLLDKYQCASYINLANNNEGHGEQWSKFWSKSPEMQMQTVDGPGSGF